MKTDNLNTAREAFSKLTPAEKRTLFRELGECTCAEIARQVVQSPRSVIGALIGGVLGALLEPPKQTAPKWDGLCSAKKHGLDHRFQICDLCARERK